MLAGVHTQIDTQTQSTTEKRWCADDKAFLCSGIKATLHCFSFFWSVCYFGGPCRYCSNSDELCQCDVPIIPFSWWYHRLIAPPPHLSPLPVSHSSSLTAIQCRESLQLPAHAQGVQIEKDRQPLMLSSSYERRRKWNNVFMADLTPEFPL